MDQRPIGEPAVNNTSGQPYGPDNPVISTGQWVMNILVALIPVVGIIVLLYWALSESTRPEIKNWAAAMLIWMVILVVISFMVLLFVIRKMNAAA